METVGAFAATLFFVCDIVAAATSDSCPPGRYKEPGTNYCAVCSPCSGREVVAECTETSDRQCHRYRCANPQHIWTDVFYICRAVEEEDCLRQNRSKPMDCQQMDGHCGCQIAQDRQHVECVCQSEPPTTGQLQRTEPPPTESRQRTSPSSLVMVTPTHQGGSFDQDESRGVSDQSDLVLGLGVFSGLVTVFVVCIVVWFVRSRYVTASEAGGRVKSPGGMPSGSELGLFSNSQPETPERKSSFENREGIPERSHGGIGEIGHNSRVRGNLQGRECDSPIDIDNGPAMSSPGNKPVMARDVFNCYHDKDNLLNLLGHFHAGNPSWKMVASHLGYSDSDIKSIEGSSALRMRAAEIFYDQWIQRSDANAGRLIGAARLAKRDDIVQFILGLCNERGYDNPELGSKETTL